jgi:transposase
LAVSVAATTSFDLDRFHDPFWVMDAIMTGSGFEGASAHTSNRKSGRSGRVEILVRGDRRRSWTPEQKCQIVSESLEPGVTPSEVARRHGIGTGQLYTWRRQMVGVQSALSTQSGPRFASVEVGPAAPLPDQLPASAAPAAPSSSRTEGLIEIVLLSGVSLRVDAHVDGRALHQVLSALADH